MPCYVIIISWRDWCPIYLHNLEILLLIILWSRCWGVHSATPQNSSSDTFRHSPAHKLSITTFHHSDASQFIFRHLPSLALLTHSLWLWSSAFQVSNLILRIKVAQREDSNTRSGCSKHGLTHIELQLSSSRSSLPVLKVTRTQVKKGPWEWSRNC